MAKHRSNDGSVILPCYRFESRQPKMPHRRSQTARYLPDEQGRVTHFQIVENWPGTTWWFHATRGDRRASDTLRTTSRAVAEKWYAALEAGRVSIASDD